MSEIILMGHNTKLIKKNHLKMSEILSKGCKIQTIKKTDSTKLLL